MYDSSSVSSFRERERERHAQTHTDTEDATDEVGSSVKRSASATPKLRLVRRRFSSVDSKPLDEAKRSRSLKKKPRAA